MPIELVKGNLVRWIHGPANDVGVMAEVTEREVVVNFDSGEQRRFSRSADVLERVEFEKGTQVEIKSIHQIGVIDGISHVDGLILYKIGLADGSHPTCVESDVRRAIITDAIELLRTDTIQSARSLNLRLAATRLLFDHKFNRLSSLSNSRVEIKPHQVGVLHRVMNGYPHRFLLADEVGLGKTIEAGLIIKELKARGMADRVLILAPSGIVGQWQLEMVSKFNLRFARYQSNTVAILQNDYPDENVWTKRDNVIASTTYASYDEQRRKDVVYAGWDLIVIDEAHHARRTWQGNARYTDTNLYRLVSDLAELKFGRSMGLLLLTATPMQLHPFELYALIELLDPALFKNPNDFEEHRLLLSGLNKTVEQVRIWTTLSSPEQESALCEIADWLDQPREQILELLKEPNGQAEVIDGLFRLHRLSEVLIRNRKAVVGGFMPRYAAVWEVQITPPERLVYETITEYVRTGYDVSKRTSNNALGFLMATFQKLNSSSSYALQQSLLRRIDKLEKEMLEDIDVSSIEEDDVEEKLVTEADNWLSARDWDEDVIEEINELTKIIQLLGEIGIDSKAKRLMEGLDEIAVEDPNAKVIIFTQSRDTQEYLRKIIKTPWQVEVFHGQLKPSEKDDSVQRFKDAEGLCVMISTEAGGEGRNFQFCHILINYDLPWNPMKIEQRIGRLDRIGQKHPVKIINFSLTGTIEERVLDVLSRRIRVFEETIGGLDPILGDVEDNIKRIFLMASDEADLALQRFEGQLETRIRQARELETKLADFIMDTKSFRQDEVRELLDNDNPLDNETMRRFVLSALDEFGGRSKPDDELEGVFKLRGSSRFYTEFEKEKFAKEGIEGRVTFDSFTAIDYETIEFLAFGHELVDALVDRVVRSKEYPRTSSFAVKTDKWDDKQGWFFTYILEFRGVMQSKELVPVFVHIDGTIDREVAQWLLENACKIEWKDGEPHMIPNRDDNLNQAHQQSEDWIVKYMLERKSELEKDNINRLNQEKEKLESLYQYRLSAAREKLYSVRRTLEMVSSSDDPQVQRIIPVWKKNLENAERLPEQTENERDRRLKELVGLEQVNAQHEIYTAAFVSIGPATTGAHQDMDVRRE